MFIVWRFIHLSITIQKVTFYLQRVTDSCVTQSSVKSPEVFLSLLTPKIPAALPPAVMGVRSVGFGHLVQLELLLDDVSFFDGSRQQLLAEFFIHVRAPVFVVPALCDHPLHSQEATSVFRKRDGHLGGGSTKM